MTRQQTSKRLERRAEREARMPGGEGPRARRNRPQTQKVPGSGPSFLPGPLRNLSGTTLALIGGGIVLVIALLWAVLQVGKPADTLAWREAELNDDPNLPGIYYAPHPGEDNTYGTIDDRQHYATGTTIPLCTPEQLEEQNYTRPLCYHTNPPTSGPHGDRPAPFGILQNVLPKEALVHSMEHGGVIIWYNTNNEDVIRQLEDIVQNHHNRRRFVALTRYPDMESETIAVTAWTRMDKFPVDAFNKQRIEDFISEHHKRFNPEGF